MNKELSEGKLYRIIFIVLMFAMIIFFFVINCNTPSMGEDYALMSFNYGYEPSSLLQRMYLIVARIITQMTTWNVRIGEQISIIFGAFNKNIFNICNSIMSIVYILLIFTYAFGRKVCSQKREDIMAIGTIFVLIVAFQPVLGEIFFWRTGSCNYLWAVSILLIFGVPIRLLLQGKDILSNKKVILVFHTILGLFAGFTNENTVVVFLFLYFVVIVSGIIYKYKRPIWVYSSFVSLVIGFLFMIEAPATKIRLQVYKDMLHLNDIGLNDYRLRIINIIVRFFTDNKWLLILALFIVCIYIIDEIISKSKMKKDLYRENILDKDGLNNALILLVSSISVAALIASPYVETRAFLLTQFFIMACITYCVVKIISGNNVFIKVIIGVIIFICSMFAIGQIKQIYSTYVTYNQFIQDRQSKIVNEKNKSKKTIVCPTYKFEANRILTPREDYLTGTGILSTYYGSNIVFGDSLEIKDDVLLNSIDNMQYDREKDTLVVEGWAAISNIDATDSNIYIILESQEGTYKFQVEKREREDVSRYYGTNYYDNTGFYFKVENIKKMLPVNTYKIGFSIENISYRKQLSNITELQIDIN